MLYNFSNTSKKYRFIEIHILFILNEITKRQSFGMFPQVTSGTDK